MPTLTDSAPEAPPRESSTSEAAWTSPPLELANMTERTSEDRIPEIVSA